MVPTGHVALGYLSKFSAHLLTRQTFAEHPCAKYIGMKNASGWPRNRIPFVTDIILNNQVLSMFYNYVYIERESVCIYK